MQWLVVIKQMKTELNFTYWKTLYIVYMYRNREQNARHPFQNNIKETFNIKKSCQDSRQTIQQSTER